MLVFKRHWMQPEFCDPDILVSSMSGHTPLNVRSRTAGVGFTPAIEAESLILGPHAPCTPENISKRFRLCGGHVQRPSPSRLQRCVLCAALNINGQAVRFSLTPHCLFCRLLLRRICWSSLQAGLCTVTWGPSGILKICLSTLGCTVPVKDAWSSGWTAMSCVEAPCSSAPRMSSGDRQSPR